MVQMHEQVRTYRVQSWMDAGTSSFTVVATFARELDFERYDAALSKFRDGMQMAVAVAIVLVQGVSGRERMSFLIQSEAVM